MNLLLELPAQMTQSDGVLIRKASQLWGFHFLLLNRILAVQVCPDFHRGFPSLNDRCYENRTIN